MQGTLFYSLVERIIMVYRIYSKRKMYLILLFLKKFSVFFLDTSMTILSAYTPAAQNDNPLQSQNIFSSLVHKKIGSKNTAFENAHHGNMHVAPSQMLGDMSRRKFQDMMNSPQAPVFALRDQRTLDATLWKRGEVFVQLENPQKNIRFLSETGYPSVSAALMHTPIQDNDTVTFIHKEPHEPVASSLQNEPRSVLTRNKILEMHAAGKAAIDAKALRLQDQTFVTHAGWRDAGSAEASHSRLLTANAAQDRGFSQQSRNASVVSSAGHSLGSGANSPVMSYSFV